MGEQYQSDGNYSKAGFYFVKARTWAKAKECWVMQAEKDIKANKYGQARAFFTLAGEADRAKECSDATGRAYS
jgi:hypothetical protein